MSLAAGIQTHYLPVRGQRSNPLHHCRGMVNRKENIIIHRQLINSASNLNTDYEDFNLSETILKMHLYL